MLTIMMGLNVEQCYCDECVRESKYWHGVSPITTICRGASYGWQRYFGGQLRLHGQPSPLQMPYPAWCRPGMRIFPMQWTGRLLKILVSVVPLLVCRLEGTQC